MYRLDSIDSLTKQAKAHGLSIWTDLLNHIQNLPYGRNENRSDLSLVLSEGKGTCSSKHALLKKLADLNLIPNVQLVLGLYEMNAKNTAGIGNVLKENSLGYIPEAHCYLVINNQRVDVTSADSSFQKIKESLLLEKEIQPEQVAKFKVNFHQEYLKNWLKESNSSFTFAEVWKIREACIANLEQTQK